MMKSNRNHIRNNRNHNRNSSSNKDNSRYNRNDLRALAACAGLALFLTGCGVQDTAFMIPAKEERTGNTSEAAAADTAGAYTADAEGAGGVYEGAGPADISGVQEEDPLIYVYVCGAVMTPGVVELKEGSRAGDALDAAGGFAEDARKDYVNLAAKIKDGEKLYFPCVSEIIESEAGEGSEDAGLVNINTADEAKLCTLPGIGEARARDIISYREENGPFQEKEDIMKVSGIKSGAYEKLCDSITVSD